MESGGEMMWRRDEMREGEENLIVMCVSVLVSSCGPASLDADA